jgi:hypothetical protein
VFVPKIADITRHDEMPRINGVIQLPKMKLIDGVNTSAYIFDVLDWCEGRAWIAGSSVVTLLDDGKDWTWNDFDVFCWSDEIYHEMRLEALASYAYTEILAENERSILLDDVVIGDERISSPINLVKPCGEDWSEPYNLLKNFDLTCAAAVLKNREEAYVWNPLHIRSKQQALIKLRNPMKTIGRIFKYWGRGFIPTSALWAELVNDEQGKHLLDMVAPLTHVFEDSAVLENLALTVGLLVPDMSSADDPWNERWDDEDYYEDSWY